jgi:hypothetical protein
VTDGLDVTRLERVLARAKQDEWEGPIPREVPVVTGIVAAALEAYVPNFWESSAETIAVILRDHPQVRLMVQDTNETLLAYALRMTRM